jgi:adenylate cyclase
LSREHVERRLAAILAADVAGSCRLIGIDEEGTLAQLKALRKTLFDPKIAEHHGRVVKNTGDGALVEFASVVDAVRCADEIQRSAAEQNIDVPQNKRIELRIGIHVGDIIIEANDIFGDGVNIAVRLEGIAEPGGVSISDDAHRQIRGKIDLDYDDMGPQVLKNIAEPIRVWRLRIGPSSSPAMLIKPPTETAQPLALPDKPSIAVLPFQNMSSDPEQEYFADGMVEDIITALSRFKSLFVIARNSSFTYKGKAVDIKQVGRELGVRYVLEGSVRKAAGRVRVTGQLLDAQTNRHVWANQFDGDLADVFALQDDITQSVVGTIVPTIQLAEMEQARRARPLNLDAYDLYLRGQWLHNQMASPDSLAQALQLYDQAIQVDPTFVAPLVEAAFACIVKVSQDWVPPVEGLQHAKPSYAERALQLDPNDSDVLATAAFVGAVTRGAGNEWIAMVIRAVALNPNSAFAWGRSGWVHTCSAKSETAIAHFEQALRLSPKDMANWDTWTGLGNALLQAHRDDDAIAAAYAAIQHGPNFSPAWHLLIAATALADQLHEMRPAVARLAELKPDFRVGALRQWGDLINSAAFARAIEGLLKAGLPE